MLKVVEVKLFVCYFVFHNISFHTNLFGTNNLLFYGFPFEVLNTSPRTVILIRGGIAHNDKHIINTIDSHPLLRSVEHIILLGGHLQIIKIYYHRLRNGTTLPRHELETRAGAPGQCVLPLSVPYPAEKLSIHRRLLDKSGH